MAFIPDVGSLDDGILHHLTRDGDVPLVTIRWTEVGAHRIKTGTGAHSRNGWFETRIDGIQTTECRIVGKIRAAAPPVGIDRSGPGRITCHAQNIFDDVSSAHKTTTTDAHGGLPVTVDVPGDAHAGLETIVVGLNQRTRQANT